MEDAAAPCARTAVVRACFLALAAVLLLRPTTGGALAGDVETPAALAEAAAGQLCLPAIAATEQEQGLPPLLLRSIALVESARTDPATGRVVPWPWTINVGGSGYFYASKNEAVAAVQQLQAGGIRSIDVGCAQVNLLHHPNAFASLDAAFDPATNTTYAARFLNTLRRASGSWTLAAAGYHSQTAWLGYAYARRVMAIWASGGSYPGEQTLPSPTLVGGVPQRSTLSLGSLPQDRVRPGSFQRGFPQRIVPGYDARAPGYAAWLRGSDADRTRSQATLGPVARVRLNGRPLVLARWTKPRQPFWANRMLRKQRLAAAVAAAQTHGRGLRLIDGEAWAYSEPDDDGLAEYGWAPEPVYFGQASPGWIAMGGPLPRYRPSSVGGTARPYSPAGSKAAARPTRARLGPARPVCCRR